MGCSQIGGSALKDLRVILREAEHEIVWTTKHPTHTLRLMVDPAAEPLPREIAHVMM